MVTPSPTDMPMKTATANFAKHIRARVSFSGHKDSFSGRLSTVDQETVITYTDLKIKEGTMKFRKLYPLQSSGKERLNFSEIAAQLMDESKRKSAKSIDGVLQIIVRDVTNEDKLEDILFNDKDPIATEEERREFDERLEKRPKALRSNEFEIEEDYHSLLHSFHQVSPVLEKPYQLDRFTPFYFKYSHALYIYPDNCNFTHVGSRDDRNICVRVMLRETDRIELKANEQISLSSVESPFSRNCSGGHFRILMNHDLSSVTYHEKYPHFFNEFRIQLPTPLHKDHHLVFEFYHVNCYAAKATKEQSKSKNNEDNDRNNSLLNGLTNIGKASVNILGYSVLRLVEDEECIRDGFIALPVYKTLVEGYINNRDKLEPYRNGKKMFRLNVLFKSSLYPQDTRAIAFLRHSGSLLDKKSTSQRNLSGFFNILLLPRATTNMAHFKLANWDEIVPYTPSFINLLIYCMSNMKKTGLGKNNSSNGTNKLAALMQSSALNTINNTDSEEAISQALNVAFETLLTLVRGIYRKINSSSDNYDQRDTVLCSYIQYLFKNPDQAHSPVYLVLSERWDAFFDCFNKREAERKAALLNDESVDTIVNTNAITTAPTPSKRQTLKKETSDVGLVQRKLKGLSVLRKRRGSFREITGAVDEEEPITIKDTLQLSWFLYDVISKSLILDIENYKNYNRNWDPFFNAVRSVQRRIIECVIDLHNESNLKQRSSSNLSTIINSNNSSSSSSNNNNSGNSDTSNNISSTSSISSSTGTAASTSPSNAGNVSISFSNPTPQTATQNIEQSSSLAQKVNKNIALFIRDLLSISFLPGMREMDLFRKGVYDMLEDYMLSTQIKVSYSVIQMRLEFIEMLADHEYLLEFAANTSKNFLSNFIIDVILKSMKELRDCKYRAACVMLNLLTKLDFNSEYQDEERRDAISRIFMPFIENMVSELDVYTKEMRPEIVEKLSLSVIHIIKNRNRNEWDSIWKSRPPLFLTNFIKLLTLALTTLSVSKNNSSFLRISCKIILLDIMNMFQATMRDTIRNNAGVYSHVLEETILFFVKFFDVNREDMDLTHKAFIPSFCELLKFFAKTISMSALDNRWKWGVGALMKFANFPFKNEDPIFYESLMALMHPYESRLLEYSKSVEKFTLEDDNENNLVMDKDQIKAATLDKLIERITSSDSKGFDMKLIEVFFLTYRSFTKPYILMDKLIQRFGMVDKNTDSGIKVTLRVSNAIKMWVDRYFHDFDNTLICRLLQFLEETAEHDLYKSYCANLRKSLSNKLIKDDEKVSRTVMFSEEIKPAILPKGFTPYGKFNLLEWSSLELARQITLMEYEYFKKIEPKECLSGAWSKKNKYLLAPNIVALTDRWNNMTNYVATTIIAEDDVKMRRIYIAKFVEIAQELRKLNNFNGVTEIVSGLANASVHRLKKTWEGMPQDVMTTLKSLQDLCNQQQSNKNMRDALKVMFPPCVPPLSMYLKDLTFIEDGNPDLIRDGLINVAKRRQISQIILRIKNYQQTPYPLEVVPYIRDQFHSVLFKNLMDEDALWARSQILEPRAGK